MSEIVFSPDEERFFDDLGEAVDVYFQNFPDPIVPGQTVFKMWKGEKVKLTTDMLLRFPSDLVFEEMRDSAYEWVGDAVDLWPELTQAQREKFDRDFREWVWGWMLSNDCLPNCWSVKNVKPCNVRVTDANEEGNIKAAEEEA